MDPTTILSALREPQSLSILTLAEPTVSAASDSQQSRSTRNSETPNPNLTTSNPAILAADLKHYQELFSKLRFSYVEQVTKERFLRAVVADPPEHVSPEENAELEAQLKEDKSALKARKQEVRDLIGALEQQGRELARRYERVQLQTAQLEKLPAEIAILEATIADLQTRQEPRSSDPEMNLSLRSTLELVHAREQERKNVDLEIERLQASLPAKREQVQRLQDELAPIQMRKMKAVEEAQEAQRRRARGGADELEEQVRWLRGVETSMKAMLGV